MASDDNILWVRKSHRFFWRPRKAGHALGTHWLWFYIVAGSGYEKNKHNRWLKRYLMIKEGQGD